jgi:hypothetical protein
MTSINWTGRAIQSLRPDAQFVLRGSEIEWLDEVQTQPTQAEIEAEVARLQARADVPAHVSPLQMRRALRAAGLFDAVSSYVETMADEAREAWEYAVQIERGNALIAAAASVMGKTEAEVDDLFRLAATL